MNKFRIALQTFLFVLFIVTLSSVVEAQATRTWVSGVGDDVNPCSRTAPCKTFAGAISKTATNGEINCIDPGGFGAVTITKSITIDCTDNFGSILASSNTNGVIINSSTASVRLRGLSINGAGSGLNGIRILTAAKVSMEDMAIHNFNQHGISVEMSAGALSMTLDNVEIRNNAIHGINSFLTGAATMNLSIVNSQLVLNNNVGLNLGAAVKASVRDSVLSSNATGIISVGNSISVSDSDISSNTTGISVSGGGVVRIAGNTITNNGTGLSVSGGSILSLSNNMIDGNTTNGTPTGFITPL